MKSNGKIEIAAKTTARSMRVFRQLRIPKIPS
jgi:hypothetical protein